MLKKIVVFALVAMLVFSMVGCQPAAPAPTATPADGAAAPAATTEAAPWKIGIMTGTVSQNEEDYRAAQEVLAKYGEEHVIVMTYPDKFMDEQETTISNVVNMASDPDVKGIVFMQAVPGAAAAFEKAREINPDLLLIAGVPGEDPGVIAALADMSMNVDEIAMGVTIPEQAKKQGAKTFVHYSFPRHMSYPLLSTRRDLFKENCEKLGIAFVDATAPDPTGDAGVSGAQQFILEDVPRMIATYGKDTAFFSTNCSMQTPLIKATLDGGGIYPQPCCPSPYHGFPSALGIEIPEDKKGDIPYVVEQITAKIAERGGAGRFSTWPVPVGMMFLNGSADYAADYAQGKTTNKNDMALLKQKFEDYAKTEISVTLLEENGKKYDNYYMILVGFLNF